MNDDYFFSVNRLVEFGLSLAISQQMVKTMNDAMTNMKTPGTFPNFQVQQKNFFVLVDGEQKGPLNEDEITKLIVDGKITKETFVWIPGSQGWAFASKINDVNKLFLLTPPSPPLNLK